MTAFGKLPLFKRAALFLAQTRQEMRKVSWPTLQETKVTTIFVFVFALVAAAYLMLVDQIIYRCLSWLIS